MRDDRKGLTQNNEILLWGGLAMLGLHFYIELHSFFINLGWSHPAVDRIFDKLTLNTKFVVNAWWMKLISAALIVGYGAASRGVKSIDLNTKSVVRALLIGLVVYFGSTWMVIYGDWFLNWIDVDELSIGYLIITVVGILYLLKGSHYISRLIHCMPYS